MGRKLAQSSTCVCNNAHANHAQQQARGAAASIADSLTLGVKGSAFNRERLHDTDRHLCLAKTLINLGPPVAVNNAASATLAHPYAT